MDIQNREFDSVEAPRHYNLGIETFEYIASWGMSYAEGNIIKYVTRWKFKGGVEDLKKARWYLDQLIQANTPPAEQSAKPEWIPPTAEENEEYIRQLNRLRYPETIKQWEEEDDWSRSSVPTDIDGNEIIEAPQLQLPEVVWKPTRNYPFLERGPSLNIRPRYPASLEELEDARDIRAESRASREGDDGG